MILSAATLVPMVYGASSEEEIATWLAREYPAVLEQVLVIDRTPIDPRTTRARISVRIVPPGHHRADREILFVAEEDAVRGLKVSQIRPIGASVLDQMRTLKTLHPDWSRDSVIAAIRLERTSKAKPPASASTCLRQLFLSSVEVVPNASTFMDPTSYFIHCSSTAGEVTVTILGPGAESPKQPNSLLRRIECIRRYL